MVNYLCYVFIVLCVLVLGILLTFKTASSQKKSLKWQTKIFFLDKTKWGKKLLASMEKDNDDPSFLLLVRINGIILIFISLIALTILILKGISFFSIW